MVGRHTPREERGRGKRASIYGEVCSARKSWLFAHTSCGWEGASAVRVFSSTHSDAGRISKVCVCLGTCEHAESECASKYVRVGGSPILFDNKKKIEKKGL